MSVRRSAWKPFAAPVFLASLVVALGYVAYNAVDPLPPRQFTIAAGVPGSPFDTFARQYAAILERHGVKLGIRNFTDAAGSLDLLRDVDSGVQASFATFGSTGPADVGILYSLGGVYDAAIFSFHRGAQPLTQFAELRGRRISIGPPGTPLRSVMYEVLRVTGTLDNSTELSDLDYDQALDALIAGKLDAAFFPSSLDGSFLQRALVAPGLRLMSVAQAEAIAKTVPGLKRVVLWRGLVDLGRDLPGADVDLIALRTRMLVRSDLHPALQYLLLEAVREVHWAPGPFNRLGEFPAEQPDDLPLSPTALAFYRGGSTFWHRYTSFWLASLLNRTLFFVIPVVALLVPVIGYAPRLYRWRHVRRIDQLHRALRELEHAALGSSAGQPGARARIARVEQAVGSLRMTRGFEAELFCLQEHLRVVQERTARTPEP